MYKKGRENLDSFGGRNEIINQIQHNEPNETIINYKIITNAAYMINGTKLNEHENMRSHTDRQIDSKQ